MSGVVIADTRRWDEPVAAASPRGWLKSEAGCVGFYLDYGPDHLRSGHTSDIGGGRVVSFCRPDKKCRDCQPGNVLAVRYPDGAGELSHASRYAETVSQARAFVESGTS